MHPPGTDCTCNARPRGDVLTNASVLQVDPTRTTPIQNRFVSRIQNFTRLVRGKVWEFLVTRDALGMKEKRNPILSFHAHEREFAFLTDADKLAAFNRWFADMVTAGLAFPDAGVSASRPWTTEYVESAYRRGLMNSFLAARASGALRGTLLADTTQEQFLRSAFTAPEAFSKVRLLGTRSFESLKGITATMGTEMNRILAEGMIDGRGVSAIAREMTRRIDGISRQRSLTIARTEVVHAHAEGQLDSFERLGVTQLGVRAEWVTAGDERVCPLCAPLQGRTFTIKQARGMIPKHPNCRCSWVPSIPARFRRQ